MSETGINNGNPCCCEKIFQKQESLITHKVMHTEEEHREKEGRVFSQKSVLLKHMPENFSNFKEKQTVFNHRREFHLGDNSSLCPKIGIIRKSISAASDVNIVQKTVGLVDPSKSFNDETTQNSTTFEKWGCKSMVKKPRLQIGKPQIEKRTESLNFDYLNVSVSTVKKPLHICPVCKTGFTTTTSMRKHIAAHFDNPAYSCDNCHVKFRTRVAMTYHKNQVHSDNQTKGKPSDSTRVKSNGSDSTKKSSKESSTNAESQSQQPIRVRHSPSEDPHIWPKVFISRRLNDFLNLNQ
ncbi:zinc finger protein 84-like isoform X2 [Daphnia pulicaria]|uniref:zinc finger protein 84-like isoform X2 n=1 Tax=Daphnia pulicaria TaxID=35523 RepID=UPI001EEC5BD3|nr:zinc finger protein 84-like isoform X2 [Daphnia pulicaria]